MLAGAWTKEQTGLSTSYYLSSLWAAPTEWLSNATAIFMSEEAKNPDACIQVNEQATQVCADDSSTPNYFCYSVCIHQCCHWWVGKFFILGCHAVWQCQFDVSLNLHWSLHKPPGSNSQGCFKPSILTYDLLCNHLFTRFRSSDKIIPCCFILQQPNWSSLIESSLKESEPKFVQSTVCSNIAKLHYRNNVYII